MKPINQNQDKSPIPPLAAEAIAKHAPQISRVISHRLNRKNLPAEAQPAASAIHLALLLAEDKSSKLLMDEWILPHKRNKCLNDMDCGNR